MMNLKSLVMMGLIGLSIGATAPKAFAAGGAVDTFLLGIDQRNGAVSALSYEEDNSTQFSDNEGKSLRVFENYQSVVFDKDLLYSATFNEEGRVVTLYLLGQKQGRVEFRYNDSTVEVSVYSPNTNVVESEIMTLKDAEELSRVLLGYSKTAE